MRFRMLLTAAAVIAIAVALCLFWRDPNETVEQGWHSVTISFLSYSNNDAIIGVANRSLQGIEFSPFVEIEYADGGKNGSFREGEALEIEAVTGADPKGAPLVVIPPQGTLVFHIPAPKLPSCKWRVKVSGVDLLERHWKRTFNRLPFERAALLEKTHFAKSDWIENR